MFNHLTRWSLWVSNDENFLLYIHLVKMDSLPGVGEEEVVISQLQRKLGQAKVFQMRKDSKET